MRRCTWLAWVALVAAVAAPLSGSTFLHMSREELATQAGAVVVGEVLQVNSFWEPTGRIIVTEAMVAVEEVLLGEAPTVAVVRTFGGTVDGFTVEAHGFPVFEVGARMLLYLENDRAVQGAHRVLGFREGQYRVVRGARGEELAVPMLDAGARLLTPDGRPAPEPVVVPLDEMRRQIRDAGVRAGREVY